jgi:hypothetical protein
MSLSKKEIIAQRCLAGERYASIARDFDMTRERVRQIARDAGAPRRHSSKQQFCQRVEAVESFVRGGVTYCNALDLSSVSPKRMKTLGLSIDKEVREKALLRSYSEHAATIKEIDEAGGNCTDFAMALGCSVSVAIYILKRFDMEIYNRMRERGIRKARPSVAIWAGIVAQLQSFSR